MNKISGLIYGIPLIRILPMRNLLLGFIAILLVGCVTVVPYNQKAMNLHIGMTKQDVVGLLGNPKKVAARSTPKGIEEKYSYWGISRVGIISMDNEILSQDRLYVTLIDGKVTEWGDKYDPSTIMDKSMENADKYREMYKAVPKENTTN